MQAMTVTEAEKPKMLFVPKNIGIRIAYLSPDTLFYCLLELVP